MKNFSLKLIIIGKIRLREMKKKQTIISVLYQTIETNFMSI